VKSELAAKHVIFVFPFSDVDNVEFRLIDERFNNSTEGRLEVKRIGIWGSICTDGFDDIDAKVACNSLGFGSVHDS